MCGLISGTIFLCGCKKIKFIEEKPETVLYETYKNTELEEERIYVKDRASFRKLYEPEITDGVFNFVYISFNEIPTLYKGEVLVYKDALGTIPSSLVMIRLKSIGYNFGIYGGFLNTNSEYVFSPSSVVEKSSGFKRFTEASGEIRVVSMDGHKITENYVFQGILGGNCDLDGDSKHVFEIRQGTNYFSDIELKADTFSMIEMERYSLSGAQETQNGYIQFKMNDDAKTGYYYIDGMGVFRYVAKTQEEATDVKSLDFYEPLYNVQSVKEEKAPQKEKEEKPETSYQTFSKSITEVKDDYEFTVYYEETATAPNIILVSPQGNKYSMTKVDGVNASTVSLAQASIGEWKIYVMDKNLKVVDVKASEKEKEVVKKTVSKEFEIDSLGASYRVKVVCDGSLYNAYVMSESTKEVNLLKPISGDTYEYVYPFVNKDTYRIVVICDESADVSEIIMEDCSNYEKDTLFFN